jgi:signal transduction histidine kinase
MVTPSNPDSATPRPDRQRPVADGADGRPAARDGRRAFRRHEDQDVHEERALLARALDILAGPGDANAQLAAILGTVARVVGARRAALVVDEPTRRVTVAIDADEREEAGRPLAAWLDAHAPRSAARRAAAPSAPVVIVRARGGASVAQVTAREDADPTYFLVPISGTGGVHLGVELSSGISPARITERLPASTFRHLLIALALASGRADDERERAEMRARDAERTRFLSMVAHELRTPLTGLGGYLDLLLEGRVGDPGVEREFLERSRRITESMAELVGDLLEVSRIESGSIGLRVDPFSLAEACARALEALEPTASVAGIRLVRDLPPRLRPATGDRRRVEQIVTNLVANAIKFTPHGGLVELEAWTVATAAFVAVRDTGPGIAVGDRERIFEPFVRLAGQDRVPGTGLGLPIARDLARAMRGELGVASLPGVGTTFLLVLPGAANANRSAIEGVVATALEAEEVTLEERSVIAALRGTARSLEQGHDRRASTDARVVPGSASDGSAA